MEYVQFPTKFIREAAQTTTEQALFNALARWLPKIIVADRASVALIEPDNQLKIMAIEGNNVIDSGKSIPVENTFIGMAYAADDPLICPDMRDQIHFLDCMILTSAGLMSCLDAPLKKGNQRYGTINLAHQEANHFTESDCVVLQCLTDWIGVHLSALR